MPRCNWQIEPKLIDNRGISSRTLYSDAPKSYLRVLNPTQEPMIIKRGYCFGNAETIGFNCEKCGAVCFCVSVVETSEKSATRAVKTAQRGQNVGTVNAVNENKSFGNGTHACNADPNGLLLDNDTLNVES